MSMDHYFLRGEGDRLGNFLGHVKITKMYTVFKYTFKLCMIFFGGC